MIEPYLGRTVLDLGAGIGAVTAHYAEGRGVVACDRSDTCVAALRNRFGDASNVTVIQGDLTAAERLGGALRIRRDAQRARAHRGRRRRPLVTAGVPSTCRQARRLRAGPQRTVRQMDRKLGHYRRYSKWRFKEIAADAGLQIVTLRYVNALAIPAWIAFSHSNTDRTYGPSLSVWDRTGVPLSRAIEERVRVPVGLNLLAVLTSRS